MDLYLKVVFFRLKSKPASVKKQLKMFLNISFERDFPCKGFFVIHKKLF